MEMKIQDDKFFVVEMGQNKWIYDSESTAIRAMKELISESTDLNPENVSILEVNTKEKKWEVKELPWSRIAITLIKGEA